MINNTPCKIGEEYKILIDGLNDAGEGVGRVAGMVVFVPGALPGESVVAGIRLVKKSYATGELLAVLEASPDRVAPSCRFFGHCGGCQLQHIDYQAQLRLKRVKIADAIERIARLSAPNVLPVLNGGKPWHYRNKMLLPVGGRTGETVLGCYARHSHNVVDTPDCLIQDHDNNQLAAVVRDWLNKYNIPPYDEMTGKGLVRHVMGRVGGVAGDIMAALITRTKNIPHLSELIDMLQRRLPRLSSVVQIVNEYRDNRILAGQEYLLWGKKRIISSLNGFTFEISAGSFFQVNSLQTAALYLAAVDMAHLTGRESVVEVCSGVGSSSMFIARKARTLTGVEMSPRAVADARANARLNGFSNIRFIVGDMASQLFTLAAGGLRPDVLFADPPRAGLGEKTVEGIVKLAPETIIYISCNPASLARDIALFGKNYLAVEFLPVDMFPMTSHVECIVRLKICD